MQNLPILFNLFIAGGVSLFIGFVFAPFFIKYIYFRKLWRQKLRTLNTQNSDFKNIHNTEEIEVPRVGGAIIVIITFLTIIVLFALSKFSGVTSLGSMDFLSRSQTLLPLGTFLFGAIIGLFDDGIQIFGRGFWATDPIALRYIKSGSIILLGALVGLWFYVKLGIASVHVPFVGDFYLGIFFIPFFIFVLFSVFSGSVIDGIDGLSGGVLMSIFGSYAVITYFRNQYDLSALAVVVLCSVLVFLWYNIMPAKFYMGEVGMIALTSLITVYAFFTDTVLLLPIIVFPLFITSVSVVAQLVSKNFFNGKKIFKVAPIHHHFEVLGWGKHKVVMRFWIIGFMSSLLGTILAFIS
jgi:phospho-N-acetylmuramoyl-pentapeptide-transferase